VSPSPSAAQAELPLELQWQAPSECPQAADLSAELARIARAQPGFTLTPLAASGTVEQHAGQYRVQLKTQYAGEAGERQLEARDCATLARSVTLVLALAFGPGVELVREPELPEAQTTPEAEVAPVVEPEPKLVEPPPPVPSTVRTALLVGAAAQLALLPSPALALGLGVEVSSVPWSVELHTSAWPGVNEDAAPDAHARFDGLGGTLLGCGELTRVALRAQLCGGAGVAALRGRTSGQLETKTAVAPWYALAAGGQLSWPSSGSLRLRLEARLALSLNRPRFVIENLSQTQRVPLLVPDLGASVSIDL
jgi:hypothetical protein